MFIRAVNAANIVTLNKLINVMVKHIVLFKLKEELPLNQKESIMKSFKDAIEALPKQISFIREIEVGINMNSSEEWDIALYSVFDNLEDVKAYSIHPAHVEAAKILANAKKDRSCVDYQL